MSDDLIAKIREFHQNQGKNISLRALSKKMGYTDHTYLHQVETGKRPPSRGFINRFCDALELSPKDRGELLHQLEGKTRGNQTEMEKELNELLKEKGIIVSAYTGQLSEEAMKVLIEKVKEM